MGNTFFFNFSPNKNGGETILFTCTYEEIGLPTEEITLESYGSRVTFTTAGIFTSKNLFQLAKELQRFELKQEMKNNLLKKND